MSTENDKANRIILDGLKSLSGAVAGGSLTALVAATAAGGVATATGVLPALGIAWGVSTLLRVGLSKLDDRENAETQALRDRLQETIDDCRERLCVVGADVTEIKVEGHADNQKLKQSIEAVLELGREQDYDLAGILEQVHLQADDLTALRQAFADHDDVVQAAVAGLAAGVEDILAQLAQNRAANKAEHDDHGKKIDAVQATLEVRVADLVRLPRPPAAPSRKGLRPGAAVLLRAESDAVPFYGRTTEQEDIVGWCEDEDVPLGVRVYTAPGGTGKTRLFIKACGLLAAKGWVAGFVQNRIDKPEEQELQAALDCGMPLFIVVDYAATQDERTRKLLEALLVGERRHGARVVLLEREIGEWWENLKHGGRVGEWLRDYCPPPLPLDPVAVGAADRQDFFKKACDAYAALLDMTLPEGDVPDLRHDQVFNRALFILIAALAYLDGEKLETEDALLAYAVCRETTLLREMMFNGKSLEAYATTANVTDVLALTTLLGPITDMKYAADLLKTIYAFQDAGNNAVLELVRCLQVLSPAESGGFRGVEPDLLGEHLLTNCESTDPGHVKALILGGVELMRLPELHWTLRVLTRANRAKPCFGAMLVELMEAEPAKLLLPSLLAAKAMGGPLFVRLGNVQPDEFSAACLAPLEPHLPEHTTALRTFAYLVIKAAVAASLQCDAKDDDWKNAYAGHLNNLANRLSDLGRREDALVPAEEAVGIYRELAAGNADAFRPDLASSLNNLATMLSALGRREDALVPAEEAVAIHRELAAGNPEAFRPDLAMSLGMLGSVRRAGEQGAMAVEAFAEGLETILPFAVRLPQAFAPLALSLARDMVSTAEEAGCELTDEQTVMLATLAELVESLQDAEGDAEEG